MTDALTARQAQILKSLIDEYIDTAEPVGSEVIEKKYNLGVSPATIRNEMVSLTKQGFLRQPHTSAGRIPSPRAMKFYVGQLMEEKQMSLAEEVKAKEEVWDVRNDLDKLLKEATHSLAERTKNLAVTALEDGRVWHSGYSNIFANPEFADLGVCTSLFSLLEEVKRLHQMFFEREQVSDPIDLFFGEEMGWSELSPIGVVSAHFKIRGENGALGVIGPIRLSYPTVIPVLKYFRNLIEEVANG